VSRLPTSCVTVTVIMSVLDVKMVRKFQQDILSWRRAEVVRLMSRGKSVHEIATILKVDPRTVYRDMEYANRNARMIIDKYVTDTVPRELMKCLSRLNQTSDEAWKIVDKKET
jgi:IS30 family transposase